MAGVNADDCNNCRLSVDGGFGLSAADKELYAACDRTGRTPAGLECSSIERQCYRCFCYTSVTSGCLRCAVAGGCGDQRWDAAAAPVHVQVCCRAGRLQCSQLVQICSTWSYIQQVIGMLVCNIQDSCCGLRAAAFMCNCHCSDSSYCSNAIGLLALQYSSQVGVVLAILGINMLLSLTSRRLTLFEKHHTRSSEARALAHRLFLAQVRHKARQRHPEVSLTRKPMGCLLASHDRAGTGI